MFTENMLESIKKVEATREERMKTEPRRMTAEEKENLLKNYHPDYREDGFSEIKVGPNKGQKAPKELADLIHSNSRLLTDKVDLSKVDYETDVLVIGGGGAGSSAAIEAHEAGADVMIVTKLRIGDANTMMAEGGIQAADNPTIHPYSTILTLSVAVTLLQDPSFSEDSLWKLPTLSNGLTTSVLCSISRKTAQWLQPTVVVLQEKECMLVRTIQVLKS